LATFRLPLTGKGEQVSLEHDAIIVATGAEEYEPQGEYLYGLNKNVLTQTELEKHLAEEDTSFLDNREIFMMIQCVDVRNEDNSYCARLCCQQAIKNALIIKEKKPQAQIFILYRDIRTYGLSESAYTRARENGVVFIRYTENEKPEVRETGAVLEIKVKDATLDNELTLASDMVILSTGIVPGKGNQEISKLLKISLSKDGFFLERHLKLFPGECATPGIYICGLAHFPKTAGETITTATATSVNAFKILCNEEIELEAKASTIIEENCDVCAYCVEPCPNDTITLLEYIYLYISNFYKKKS